MKVKLHLMERLYLLELLPKEGSFLTLKSIRQGREALSLNEEELKKFEVKQEGDTIRWNVEKAKDEVEIELADIVVDIIKSKLRELSESKKLEDKYFTIYQKFIGDE